LQVISVVSGKVNAVDGVLNRHRGDAGQECRRRVIVRDKHLI
jgi:hypothetical protein